MIPPPGGGAGTFLRLQTGLRVWEEVFAKRVAMLERQGKSAIYLLALLVIGASTRALVLMKLHGPIFPGIELIDYALAAHDILRFNFHALGDRVPVYPLLLALCGLNPWAIWITQSLLGIASSLMLFDMAFRRTRHALFSLLVALTCSLIPEIVVAYEHYIQAEVLTNFFLVVSLWLITRCDGAEEGNIRYTSGLGTIVALAGLTRPVMIFLVPIYYCFLVPLWPPVQVLRREQLKKGLSYALPAIVLISGWCGFNYFNNGWFAPTTRGGEHLMMQVDPYVDLAPDRFAELRDLWLQTRHRANVNFNGNVEDVYWNLLEEMGRRTGKTDAQISHEYASLALYLEIHHPFLCLRRAEQGWMKFWGEPGEFELDWPPSDKLRWSEALTALADFLVCEVKAAFLILALLSIPLAFFPVKAFTKCEYLIFAIALAVSVGSAFTEFGVNRRYCVPLYMLIFYTVLTRGWIWITSTWPRA